MVKLFLPLMASNLHETNLLKPTFHSKQNQRWDIIIGSVMDLLHYWTKDIFLRDWNYYCFDRECWLFSHKIIWITESSIRFFALSQYAEQWQNHPEIIFERNRETSVFIFCVGKNKTKTKQNSLSSFSKSINTQAINTQVFWILYK